MAMISLPGRQPPHLMLRESPIIAMGFRWRARRGWQGFDWLENRHRRRYHAAPLNRRAIALYRRCAADFTDTRRRDKMRAI